MSRVNTTEVKTVNCGFYYYSKCWVDQMPCATPCRHTMLKIYERKFPHLKQSMKWREYERKHFQVN